MSSCFVGVNSFNVYYSQKRHSFV